MSASPPPRLEIRHAVSPHEAKAMDTSALRGHFLGQGLFREGEISLIYTHYDRLILGGAVPNGGRLSLDALPPTGTPSWLDRREAGIVNIGAEMGIVEAGGQRYSLEKGDVLYLPRGTGAVHFEGMGRFIITSCPAHASLPARHLKRSDANCFEAGSSETANRRQIRQFIHPLVMPSCQLVLGYTEFEAGSVWNTMPCHTHDRRMEAYVYFDLAADTQVLHLLGEPQETRHLWVGNEEAALSPPWSIHSGVGTGKYSFLWVMAGDNIDYTDMDMIATETLR